MEFEHGGIHHEEFMRTVIGLAGLEMSHDEFEACWVDIFTLNEPMARLVADLKRQGYTLLLGRIPTSSTPGSIAGSSPRRWTSSITSCSPTKSSREACPEFFRACVEKVGAPAARASSSTTRRRTSRERRRRGSWRSIIAIRPA